MQLYIDSNIYLEYFRENSAERLAPLKELIKLIEKKKITLILPSQTKQEYFRNRRKIAEITRSALIKHSNISSMIPAVIDKGAKEVKEVLSNTKNLIKSYKKLIDKYDREVEKEKTDADLLINELFSKHARIITEPEDIVLSAYRRYMKGNPPRKSDHSYGDAIIWETLLKEGKNDNLVLITKDSDFAEIHKGKPVINQFLFVEWRIKTKKKKRVVLYKSLAEFVNSFNKKETIKKEIVQKENDSSIPILTKRLSYQIQQGPTGPTGPAGPFRVYDTVDFPSSLTAEIPIISDSTFINPQYGNIIPNSGILNVPNNDSLLYMNSRCKICNNELPQSPGLLGSVYCPVCGTFNH